MATKTGITLGLRFKENTLQMSADCGGSAIKLVFAKELPGQEDNGKKKQYELEVKSFSREDLHEAGVFIKENYPHLLQAKGEEAPKLYATGVGANMFVERVNKSLSVELHIMDEMTVFMKCLRYMASTLTKRQFLYDVPDEIFTEIDEVFRRTKTSHDAWSKNSEVHLPLSEHSLETNFWRRPAEIHNGDTPYAEVAGDTMYPCLMVPLGSCLLLVRVDADGSGKLVSFSPRCGRMFLGLGHLLTGVETFDDLLELAIKGDSSALDQSAVENQGSGKDGAYNEGIRHMAKTVLYSFGKAVGTKVDQWKKEDLARCLLRNALEDIAMETMHTAREQGVKRVFFVGSLTNSQFIRDEMARVIGFYNVFHPTDKARYEFVRYGGHLGAIGSLLSGCEYDTK